jgi:hypothetical protein
MRIGGKVLFVQPYAKRAFRVPKQAAKSKFAARLPLKKRHFNTSIYIKLNVCLYILYANLQFYFDLDEILYT